MGIDNILPLAITQVDSSLACVAGITDSNEWIRPEPIYVSDIKNGLFKYEYTTKITYEKLNVVDARKEDKRLWGAKNQYFRPKYDKNFKSRIYTVLDESLENIFCSGRSVGIIKINIKDITYGRTLGGKKNFRLIFTNNNKEYNFIVRDYFFVQEMQKELINGRLQEKYKKNIITKYSISEVFLTVSLTKPTSFSGPYNGCHAIAAGIHCY